MQETNDEQRETDTVDNDIVIIDTKKDIVNVKKEKNINLFSIIVHDLCGPMTSIVSMVKLLRYKGYDSKIFNALEKASETALSRLDELFQWGLSNQMHYNPKKTEISKLVDKVVDFCSTMSEQKSVDIINLIQEQEVYLDENMFCFVLC
jgi:signal transduction histidine kinase